MCAAMQRFHPELKPGDAFLHNSPYHGCSHPADHTLLVPVFDEAGTHHFTVLAKAHQADCGNSIPTTYMGAARDVYEEGALIFPAVQVQRDFRDIEDVVRMCQMRIRVPEQWWGDYLAMVGAARIGEREFLALAVDVGWDRLSQPYRAMVRLLRATHDPGDPQAASRGAAVRTSRPRSGAWHAAGGRRDQGRQSMSIPTRRRCIEVDLRDNPDSLPCGLNLSEACARTAAMVGVYNSIDHTVPKNAGSHPAHQGAVARRLHRRHSAPSDQLLGGDHQPRRPRRQSGAVRHRRDQRRRRSLPNAAPLSRPARRWCRVSIPAAAGPSSTSFSSACRAARARRRADAWQTICHVGNAGLCYVDSVELDELRQPMRVCDRRFLTDSEGAGRHRGASSLKVDLRADQAPASTWPMSATARSTPPAAMRMQRPTAHERTGCASTGTGRPDPRCTYLRRRHASGRREDPDPPTGGGGYGVRARRRRAGRGGAGCSRGLDQPRQGGFDLSGRRSMAQDGWMPPRPRMLEADSVAAAAGE